MKNRIVLVFGTRLIYQIMNYRTGYRVYGIWPIILISIEYALKFLVLTRNSIFVYVHSIVYPCVYLCLFSLICIIFFWLSYISLYNFQLTVLFSFWLFFYLYPVISFFFFYSINFIILFIIVIQLSVLLNFRFHLFIFDYLYYFCIYIFFNSVICIIFLSSCLSTLPNRVKSVKQ